MDRSPAYRARLLTRDLRKVWHVQKLLVDLTTHDKTFGDDNSRGDNDQAKPIKAAAALISFTDVMPGKSTSISAVTSVRKT